MSMYVAPVSDYLFLLEHVLDYQERMASMPIYEEASLELLEAVLDAGSAIAQDILAPLNRSGDEEGCHINEGEVSTPSGFRQAYNTYRQGGWTGLVASPKFGGQGLPRVIGLIQREIVSGANTAFGTYLGLSQSAYFAIAEHASEDLKERFLPPLVEGRWMGTMCLTEAHCGSDLGLIRTRATRNNDNTYNIIGTKIFVSAGEHDLAENIIHLVLARLPDGPPGTKGLSLFAVPKLLPSNDNKWIIKNHLKCTGIEKKMGINASVTATLDFDDAKGWLIGKEHQGLSAMFTMMNSSRLGVSIQAVGLAEAALQMANLYAHERLQGRAPNTTARPVPIIYHADVRRNLLSVRAFVEGARALSLWAGLLLDEQLAHPNIEYRNKCDELLALLTPVLKSFFSDRSFQATNAAMQIFGGHGYIREMGIEQYIRDGRIIPLYEGTNGIQALDLVSRKIKMNNGQTVEAFFQLVDSQAQEMKVFRLDFSRALSQALDHLKDATIKMNQQAEHDPYMHGATGHDYLQLFGLVAMGFAWSRIICAVLEQKKPISPDIVNSKLETAAFFFQRVLAETDFRYQLILAGSEPITAAANNL